MPKQSQKTSKKKAIDIQDCTVSFGDNVVVKDVSFEIERGTVAALIGPNGSGKTTLIKAILGLIEMDQGKARFFGSPLEEMKDRIGYVPQRLDFDTNFPITVREFMDLARHHHCPKSRIEEMLEEVGLDTGVADQQFGKLSGGQFQRVLIAQSLINEPWLLILDEPATGIDIVGEEAFFRIIRHLKKEHNTTILMISHELAVVSELVDTVICLNKEMLCYGTPKSALTQETISEVFGKHAHLVKHGHHKRNQ